MLLDGVFLIALIALIVIEVLFTFVPLGNENSTVRRLPWITFGIMGACVIIYYVTLPSTVQQERNLLQARTKLEEFLSDNEALLADQEVRAKLKNLGLIDKQEVETIERDLNKDLETETQYKIWLRSADAIALREKFDKIMADYKVATESHLYYQYGLAPNGTWKVHQLVTAVFLHGSTLHLFGNLLFFFAVGFSLEDLWGRSTFLGFYLLAGIAACIPSLLYPIPMPSVGASGAISATLGAFLVRLHSTRIKLGWVSLPLAPIFMLMSRKPFGVINVKAYIYLPFYLISQLLPWWFINKVGLVSLVGYSAHIAGFLFGVGFALFMRATKAEENYINPKIEAKVSFSAAPAVTQSLEMLDHGQTSFAERKLKTHLVKNRDDVNAIMALIQVYQRTENYEQLNAMYGRLIHHYLVTEDKEAALYAYDNLLSSFPDNHIDVRIPARDWVAVCEYLAEAGMNREAAVEYERMANAWPDDTLTARACIQGGDAAFAAHDPERALKLYEKARALNPPSGLVTRAESGVEKCTRILDKRPNWVKQPVKAQTPIR